MGQGKVQSICSHRLQQLVENPVGMLFDAIGQCWGTTGHAFSLPWRDHVSQV